VSPSDERLEHLIGRSTLAVAYFKSLRPHQWLKNLLVFLPMLAAHQLTADTFVQSFLAFEIQS
jgi:4-hydroxybenzoate polyprenyltransferase